MRQKVFFFFKRKREQEMLRSLVGSEMFKRNGGEGGGGAETLTGSVRKPNCKVDAKTLPNQIPVPYQHLTLPTNREV